MTSGLKKADRAQWKHQLALEFGLYIAPLQEIANSETLLNIVDFRLAHRRFTEGYQSWRACCTRFLAAINYPLAPPDFATFESVSYDLFTLPDELYSRATEIDLAKLQERFSRIIQSMKIGFFADLEMIPDEWDAQMFQGNSPFTIYMRIRDAFVGVQKRIHYFDRYLRDDFFLLYMRNLDRSLEMRLITTQGDNKGSYGVSNVNVISDLARQEFSDYQLIEVSPAIMHGRSLRVDSQVFYLGSGLSHSGNYPSYPTEFAPGDSTSHGHQVLDDIISQGAVVHKPK